jgi:DNA (cytosine-5)-methyltransferase 1
MPKSLKTSIGNKPNLSEIKIASLLDKKNEIDFESELSFLDQLAIITHFYHNWNSIYELTYKEDAIRIIHKILDASKSNLQNENVLNASPAQYGLFPDVFNIPFPAPESPKFTFIDLFAGMGGFRIAMQQHGGKCVFSSEWNKYAQKTYFANFGEVPFGDITKEEIKNYIPDNFDVLCGGFPCQPFSIAGVSKKNSLGRASGFQDLTQGTLFFDVAEIIEKKRPKIIYLENVKNLESHDKKNTFKVIKGRLEELGYNIHAKVLDGKGYVPQHRERIMIVGFDKKVFNGKEEFCFPEPPENNKTISEILDPNISVESKYTLSDKLWTYLQNYAKKHKANGNGFGFGLANLNGITRTLSARYYKDGSEILIPQGEGCNPRRLTPRECAFLMGYDKKYIIDAVSEVQAYRQCGNSVVVPLITAVSANIVQTLLKENE